MLRVDFTQSRLPALGTTACLASVVFDGAAMDTQQRITQKLTERIGQAHHGAVIEGIHAGVVLCHK